MLFVCLFIYLLLVRGAERGKEREKNQYVVAFHAPPTRDLAHNPGMCPHWELNWQPFGSQVSTQSTGPHHQGCFLFHLYIIYVIKERL